MEHVSSVRPTGKFPEKVENLERWARFPGWNFRTEFRVPFNFTFLVVCTSSRSTAIKKSVMAQSANQNGFPRTHASMHGMFFCCPHSGGTFAPRVPWPWINW